MACGALSGELVDVEEVGVSLRARVSQRGLASLWLPNALVRDFVGASAEGRCGES